VKRILATVSVLLAFAGAPAVACNPEVLAKQDIIREILSDTAQRGLRGRHHYSITFRTAATGVSLPARIAAQHPEETSIILQYQFEKLRVMPDLFEVTLWFKGVKERVAVPFQSITSFVDPSVNVRLDFDPATRGPCRKAGDSALTAAS
jgi:hypothetical protein